MAWTDPRTWSVDQVVAANELNVDLRDNLNWLKNDNTDRLDRMGRSSAWLADMESGGLVVDGLQHKFLSDVDHGCVDWWELDISGTVQVRCVGSYQVTAQNACTALALAPSLFSYHRWSGNGLQYYSPFWFLTPFTVNWHNFDTGFQAVAPLDDHFGTYGCSYKWDIAGGGPTISDLSCAWYVRVI